MNADKTHEWTNQQILRLYDIVEDRNAAIALLQDALEHREAENAKLRAIVDTMFTTDDGVTIVPGMRVFFRSGNPKSRREGIEIAMADIAMAEAEDDEPFVWSLYWFEPGEGYMAIPDDVGLYSSRAALEAAEAAEEKNDAQEDCS